MEYYEKRDTFPHLENEKKIYESSSDIQNFYKGKSIFITGGTGLIGSLVVEKLLRSCPEIKMIYILMREKKGKTTKERLQSLLDNEIFHRIKRNGMDYMKKVSCVTGDCGLPNCGMSEESVEMIKKEVNIIFHIAACLSMDAHIKKAYDMNVRATKDLLDIATNMKNLKGFVYCSTAYSQSYNEYVEEKFYAPGLTHTELKDLLDSLSECEAAALTPKLVGQWSNTYAYSKAIAEDVVKGYTDKIPVVVARPSIVIGCDREPLKGWINNFFGVTGVSAAAYAGLLNVLCGDSHKKADIIPADYCANAMVVIAWDLACNRSPKLNFSERRVYNVTCDPKVSTTWGMYMELSSKHSIQDFVPTKFAICDYFLTIEPNFWIFYLQFYLFHLTKGILLDTAALLARRKPQLIKGYVKILQFNLKMVTYSLAEWVFERNNYNRMQSSMTEQDKDIFYVDLSKVDWYEYHRVTVRAIRLYLLKDTFDSLNYAKIRYRIIRYCRIAAVMLIFAIVTKYVFGLLIGLCGLIDVRRTLIRNDTLLF